MTPGQRVEALRALAHEGDARVRKSVAIALGNLGERAATPLLGELLADEDEGVRVLACQALGRVADPAALPALLERVHDESVEVRSGVLFALASIAAHGGLTAEARAELFTPMVVMAFDPHDGVRADAAAALGTLHDERAAEPLTLLAEDDVAQVRANACASLGLLDVREGVSVLLGRAEDAGEAPLVRVAALDGLARMAERGFFAAYPQAAARALRLACDLAGSNDCAGDADVRSTAVWALGMLPIGADMRACVQEALEDSLRSDYVWAQRYAIEALARIDDEESWSALHAARHLHDEGALALSPEAAEVLQRVLSME